MADFFSVVRHTFFNDFWYAPGFFSLGNKYWPGPERAIWFRSSAAAIGVSGTSAMPLSVLESGIQIVMFVRSTWSFFSGKSSFLTRKPVSVRGPQSDFCLDGL